MSDGVDVCAINESKANIDYYEAVLYSRKRIQFLALPLLLVHWCSCSAWYKK